MESKKWGIKKPTNPIHQNEASPICPHHSLYKMNTGGEIQSRQEYEEKGHSQAAIVENTWRKKRQNMKDKTTV